MTTRYAVTREELAAWFAAHGAPRYRVDQVFDALFRAADPARGRVRRSRRAARRARRGVPARARPDRGVGRRRRADGQVALAGADDDAQIETVLMRYPERATVCISSQAGCAMGCTFCATGQAGFVRHLDAGEIVEQVVRAAHASPQPVNNVVFMGMGEPLANYDATWAAVERLHEDLGLSARHITISTVGVVPGIRRLATEDLPVTLAISLHAPGRRAAATR